jgi:hypothetical protein
LEKGLLKNKLNAQVSYPKKLETLQKLVVLINTILVSMDASQESYASWETSNLNYLLNYAAAFLLAPYFLDSFSKTVRLFSMDFWRHGNKEALGRGRSNVSCCFPFSSPFIRLFRVGCPQPKPRVRFT